MARPVAGYSGGTSTKTEWLIWYDVGDLTDCLYGPFETESQMKQAARRFLVDHDVTNVSVLVRTTRVSESSTVNPVDDLTEYLAEED